MSQPRQQSPRPKIQEVPVAPKVRIHPIIRSIGMTSGIFLTVVYVATVLGKMAGIPGASDEVILVLTTLGVVAGIANFVTWQIVDNT